MTDGGVLDAERALSAAGWRDAASRGVPHLLVAPASTSVLWANAAACAVFGTDDADTIASALFRADRAPRGLATRLMRLAPTVPYRLERLHFASGFKVEILTLLCKSVRHGAQGPLTVLQVAGPAMPQPAPRVSTAATDHAGADTSGNPVEAVTPVGSLAASAASPQQKKSLEACRADLAARWPSVEHLRFVWTLDQGGRITAVGEELALVAGEHGLRVGDLLLDRLAAVAPAIVEDVVSALANRRSWRGSALWPVVGADAVVAVELGGAPRAGGYRGYGVIRLGQLSGTDPADTAPAAITEIEEVEPSRPAEDSIVATVADKPEAEAMPAAPLEAAPPNERSPDPTDMLERSGFVRVRAVPNAPIPLPHAKVVHLSAFKTASGLVAAPAARPAPPEEIVEHDAATLPEAPRWAEMPDAPGELDEPAGASQLSRNERFNFDEIARTLGGRSTGEDALPRQPLVEETGVAVGAQRVMIEEGAILDALPLGLAVTRDREVLYANRTLLDLLGYGSLAVFREAGGLTHALNGQTARPLGTAAASLVTHDGTAIAVDVRSREIGWGGEDATLISFRPSVDDEAEARAQASRLDLDKARMTARDLEAAAELAASGIGFLDPEGRLLAISAGAERLFGYDQKEVVGDHCSLFVAADQRSTWLSFFRDFAAPGPARRTTAFRRFAGVRRDGTPVRLAASLRWIEGEKICIVWNDDSRRVSGNELETLRREAERSSDLKSEFLAKVSHEIRTPLNAILGFTDIIMEERFGPINNERYKEYVKDIHASGQHVLSLINDLLDLSRIEAGGLDLNLQPVNVNVVVGDCVATMHGQAHRDRVIIRTSLAPHLPHVLADERALKQIMLNLLSNAVKFNEPGGQVIVSTAAAENGRIAIRVRDTGLGMSEEEIETAMKPFRQLATPKSAAGTGLGLPLTKALVDASRGGMTIKSRRREGTLVEVTFERASKPELSLPAE